MPANLKSAFKYPLLSKTMVTNKSLDTGSIRNELYRKDDPTDYHIKNPNRDPSYGNPPMSDGSNIVKYSELEHNEINEYELLDKVMKNPKCISLLKTILMSDRSINLTIDDVVKYTILFGAIFIIFKTLTTS